jgi:hypothetical protein
MLKEKIALPPPHLPTPVTTSWSLERVDWGMLQLNDPPALKRWVKRPATRQLLLTVSCPDNVLAVPVLVTQELPVMRAVESKRT